MPTTITLNQLTKSFPAHSGSGGSVTTAVDHVDLTIEPGELFFLLGPSGCGKTTMLRMIAGFIEPTSGQITFRDSASGKERDITFLEPDKRNTGMVFQSYALWPHMSVAENVGFGLSVRKVAKPEREARVLEALKAVRMEQYAQRKPNQLSGGQQQRVALARALVIRPDVLLLDEPLSNLDAKLRLELRSEIRRICKSGGGGLNQTPITTVYVTHDQKEALSIADRIAIVNQGTIVQMGTPAELYRRPTSKFVAEFLGETNLMPGTVIGQEQEKLVVSTPLGKLVSSTIPGHKDPRSLSGNVLVSIRPEAIRIGTPDGMNTLHGQIDSSVYLGETAQLQVTFPNHGPVNVSALNPTIGARAGERVTCGVATEDVVILPV